MVSGVDERLFEAIRDGDLDRIAELLGHGVPIDNKDRNGHGYLYKAAVTRGPRVGEAAELLIRHGADVTTTTRTGASPLHMAVIVENVEVAQVLLDHGADINAMDKKGRTPLHYAVEGNRKSILKLLLARGANQDIKNRQGETPLQIAERQGCVEIVRLLNGHDIPAPAMRDSTGFVAAEFERKAVATSSPSSPEQLADAILAIVHEHRDDDLQLKNALIRFFGTRDRPVGQTPA
jgi:uncharacterized protein